MDGETKEKYRQQFEQEMDTHRNGNQERARGVLERVTLAIESLCVGKGDVRSRLKAAVGDHLFHLREQDFPCELRGEFRKIIEQSTKYDAQDLYRAGYIPLAALSPGHELYEGSIPSTMRRIRRSTGVKIARDICHLFSALQRMAK